MPFSTGLFLSSASHGELYIYSFTAGRAMRERTRALRAKGCGENEWISLAKYASEVHCSECSFFLVNLQKDFYRGNRLLIQGL